VSHKGEQTYPLSLSALLNLLLTIVVLSSIAVLLTPRNSKPRLLGEDSLEYLEFADEIRSGHLFKFGEPDQLSRGATIRAPGYPLLLGLMNIRRGDGTGRVLLLHLIILIISLCLVFFLLPRNRSRYYGIFFAALSFFLWSEFLTVLSTEWTAFGLLVVLLSLCSVSPGDFSLRRISLFFLVASCLTLVRPEFIFLHGTVALLFFKQKQPLKILAGCLGGSLPLLSWLMINYLRLGAFQVALLGGSAFLVIGSMLGPVSPHTFSDQTTQDFAHKISPMTWTATNKDLLLSASSGAPYLIFDKYVGNLHKAWEIARTMELSPRQTDTVFLRYGIAAIRHYPDRYATHLLACIISLTFDVVLFLFILLGIRFLNGTSYELRSIWLASFFLHIAHTLVVAVTQPLIDRYFLLTQTPFTVLSFAIAAESIAIHVKRKRFRLIPNLTIRNGNKRN
jgi:hypothetical protein